jgi:hypothetical protein
MSDTSAIHELVHKRFRDVFGEPDSVLGTDNHWALKPDVPYAVSINILVDGTAKAPAVWVFDPHVKTDGVLRVFVENEQMLEDIILRIQARVTAVSAESAARHAK